MIKPKRSALIVSIALFALSGVVAKLTKDYFGSKSTLRQ